MEAGIPPSARDEADRRLERAWRLHRLGRPWEALDGVTDALGGKPDSAEAFGLTAFCRADLGEGKEALAAAVKCLSLAPDRAWSHYVVGRVSRLIGNPADALTALTDAVRLDPGDPVIRRELARLHHERGRFELCLAEAEEGLRLDPLDGECAAFRGRALQDLGRLEEAEAAYRRALALDPEMPAAHAGLGFLALRRGGGEASVRAFRDALGTDPGCESARSGLAQALLLRFPGYGWIDRVVDHLRGLPEEIRRNLAVILGVAVVAPQLLFLGMSTDEWLPDGSEEGGRIGWWTGLALLQVLLTWGWAGLFWVLRPLYLLALRFHPAGRGLVEPSRLRVPWMVLGGVLAILLILSIGILAPWPRGIHLAVLLAACLPAAGALAGESGKWEEAPLAVLVAGAILLGILGALLPENHASTYRFVSFLFGYGCLLRAFVLSITDS
ncbi:MAG: tetratricopeptide repeat protein [Planctomycetes bacterium]|nr:tetratricopeptide repeat protein [Planctomycetota bacterium]